MPTRYQAVWDAVGDALVVVDADQRIVVFNRAAEGVFGYSSGELFGQPLDVLIPERMRQAHNKQVNGFKANGVGHRKPASMRSPVVGRRRNGEEFPAEVTLSTLDVEGNLMAAATVRDVSERVAAERALADSERRFRVAFEDSPVALALLDLNMEIMEGNPALAELTGYSLLEIERKTLLDVIDSEDVPHVRHAMQSLLTGASRKARAEFHLIRPDGTSAILDLSAASVIEEGEPQYLLAQAIDITKRVQSEARLEELVRSKDELIAAVSHELRTPLTALVGFAQLLNDESPSIAPRERADMIAAIVAEAADLTNLVDDLLVAAKSKIGALVVVRVPVDLRAQARQVLETWNRDELARISLLGDPVGATGDPARVRQILRNLVANAIRYGGDHIAIHLESLDEVARVTVVDDGPQIADSDRERIFQPYQRAHQDIGVTPTMGLGLSISRDLARLMGGDLSYRFEGNENIFELNLPRGH